MEIAFPSLASSSPAFPATQGFYPRFSPSGSFRRSFPGFPTASPSSEVLRTVPGAFGTAFFIPKSKSVSLAKVDHWGSNPTLGKFLYIKWYTALGRSCTKLGWFPSSSPCSDVSRTRQEVKVHAFFIEKCHLMYNDRPRTQSADLRRRYINTHFSATIKHTKLRGLAIAFPGSKELGNA